MATPPPISGTGIRLSQPDLFSPAAAQRGTTRLRMHELTVSALSGPYLRTSDVAQVTAALREGIEQGIVDLGESSNPVRDEAYAGLALGLRDVIVACSIAYRSYLRHQALLSTFELGLLAASLRTLAAQLAQMRRDHAWPGADLGLSPLRDFLDEVESDLEQADDGVEPIASWSRSLCREINDANAKAAPRHAFDALFGLVSIGVLQGLRALPELD